MTPASRSAPTTGLSGADEIALHLRTGRHCPQPVPPHRCSPKSKSRRAGGRLGSPQVYVYSSDRARLRLSTIAQAPSCSSCSKVAEPAPASRQSARGLAKADGKP